MNRFTETASLHSEHNTSAITNMPNQPDPNRLRTCFNLQALHKLELERYGQTLGYSLSDILREVAFRAADDIREGKPLVITPSFSGSYAKGIFVCDKEDVQTVKDFAKKCRMPWSLILRQYVEDLWRDLKVNGSFYMHRKLDNET